MHDIPPKMSVGLLSRPPAIGFMTVIIRFYTIIVVMEGVVIVLFVFVKSSVFIGNEFHYFPIHVICLFLESNSKTFHSVFGV